MIKFKFNNATIEAPDSWPEVKVEIFVNPHFLSRDSLSLLSVMTGIDRTTLANSTADITPALLKMVAFLEAEPQGWKEHPPAKFTLMGVECTVPQDIELERVGQKIMFQDAMSKNKFIYEGIPDAIAIYMQPQLNNGVFDDAMLPEIRAEVMKLRIIDVFPIANFFLDSWRALTKSGPPS